MSRLPGILFGILAIVFLVVIVWARSDDTAVVMTEPELLEPEPVEVAAAPVVPEPAPAATPAEPAPAAAPVVTAAVTAAPLDIRGPGLGVPATAEEIARLNISIPPDGRNLPPGSGSSAEGALVYMEFCVGCHGPRGAGGEGMVALTGGLGTLTGTRPVKTVASFWPYATTIFDYVRRAMPLNAPQSLTDDQVYAVVAFLLSVDDILPIGMRLDATTLPTVEMPNRDGFANWWPGPPQAAAAGG